MVPSAIVFVATALVEAEALILVAAPGSVATTADIDAASIVSALAGVVAASSAVATACVGAVVGLVAAVVAAACFVVAAPIMEVAAEATELVKRGAVIVFLA